MDSVVKEICDKINNTVLNSGLHFIINQTPFSNYITIRKKFSRHPQINLAAPDLKLRNDVTQNLDSFKDTSEELGGKNRQLEENLAHKEMASILESNLELTGTIDSLKAKVDKLSRMNQQLEEELVEKEEELKASKASSWEENGNLHELIDNLEMKIEMLQQESNVKDIEFEKKLVSKNKSIKKLEKKNSNILKQLEAEATEDAKDDKISESEEAVTKEKFSVEDKVKASEGKKDDLNIVDENRNAEPKNESEVSEDTCCTICAKEIQKYEPEFFQDVEVNPACEECKFEDFRISKLPLISPERKSSTWKSPAEAIAADSSVKVNMFPPEQPFPPTVLHQVKPFPPWQSSAPLSSTFPSVKPFPPF
jgi:myosin heavy subunit